MPKQLFTLGYIMPGENNQTVDFYKSISFMDADVLVISPDTLYPKGEWVAFTVGDGGCYNVQASKKYRQQMSSLQKELEDHCNAGKTAFIFLTNKEEHSLSTGVSTLNKGENRYSTEIFCNYNFTPLSIGTLTSASGKHIEFTGNPIFSSFYKEFKNNLSYKAYTQNIGEGVPIFVGKDRSKILGAIYKIGKGHLVTLPTIDYNEEEFTSYVEGEEGTLEIWNEKGIAFGKMLVKCLLDIDNKLSGENDKSQAPEWASKKEFRTSKEIEIENSISDNIAKISRIEQENNRLKMELEEQQSFKDLLFEQGKRLEIAVIKALKLIGYNAENYNDGHLEMDQVIISPENNRYIGECEGKETKAIDISKFRQLCDSLNEDFARDEINERAFGILFGNAQRSKDPSERDLDFTEKCKLGAKRENIALVKTSDLFPLAKYLSEKNDEKFKRKCREAIHLNLGRIVAFPPIPK